MTKMFDSYDYIPEWYYPDNRPKCICCCDKQDEIIIGATAIHTFVFNFRYSEIADRFIILYKQSITNKIIIDSSALGAPYEIMETSESGFPRTYITVFLSPENTERVNPFDELFVQAKFYLKNGDVIFDNIDNIIVKDTLENKGNKADNT